MTTNSTQGNRRQIKMKIFDKKANVAALRYFNYRRNIKEADDQARELRQKTYQAFMDHAIAGGLMISPRGGIVMNSNGIAFVDMGRTWELT